MPSPLPYSTNILEELEHGPPAPLDRVYGVELECEPRSQRRADQSQLVTKLRGPVGDWYILKSDGSLDNGVEIVSLPLPLAAHADGRWATLLRPVTALAMSGARTTRCGIHVHANRANMSALTLGKILVFMNHPGNVPLVETIAQRSANSYCRRYDKRLADGAERAGGDRYQAVNVTRHTVEFRIFRGSIRPERVLKNVEFVDAVIHYCESASIATIGESTRRANAGPAAFVDYVRKSRHLYPNLHGFMVESNLITTGSL